MASPVLSFRVEEGLAQQLDLLAAATDRDRQITSSVHWFDM
jgi:predicted transcriptional regulator